MHTLGTMLDFIIKTSSRILRSYGEDERIGYFKKLIKILLHYYCITFMKNKQNKNRVYGIISALHDFLFHVSCVVQMAGTIFVVFYSFFVFQKVSTMIVIKPFPTILVFFVFNHILADFLLSVYRACTLFCYTAFKIATAFSSSFGYK